MRAERLSVVPAYMSSAPARSRGKRPRRRRGAASAAPRPQSSNLLLRDPGEGRIDLHLDLPRLRLILLGQEDAQHAVAALRGDVAQLHCRGQREAAAEGAVVALDAVIVLPLVGVL